MEHDKKLIAAMRSLQRKYGRAAFEAACNDVASGELDLMPGRPGRPGTPDRTRLLSVYHRMEAAKSVYGLTDDAAADNLIQSKALTYFRGENGKAVVGTIGHDENGRVVAHPIPQTTSKTELMKLYRRAQRTYAEDAEFRTDADYWLSISISAETARRDNKDVFETVMRDVFGFDND